MITPLLPLIGRTWVCGGDPACSRATSESVRPWTVPLTVVSKDMLPNVAVPNLAISLLPKLLPGRITPDSTIHSALAGVRVSVTEYD